MTDTSAAGTGAEPLRVARLRPGALVAGLVAVLGAMVIGMALGPVDISPKLIVYELLDDLPLIDLDSGLSAQRVAIIEQIRLPRVVLGFLVGATLSVSGAAYQGAFRNPLADPYLLGIAAGAGLGATVAITQDWGDGGGFTDPVPLAAFGGALLAVVLSYTAGHVGGRSTASLILAGVASPRMGNPRSKPPTVDEPFAVDARDFVSTRLLHRELEMTVHGTDKPGVCAVGTVHHPRGNIAVELLKAGLARVSDWSARMMDPGDVPAFRVAENNAKVRIV